MTISLLLLFTQYLFPPAITHPFHVSTCDISLNTRTNSLECVWAIFSDDLEKTLANVEKWEKLDISQDGQSPRWQKAIQKYLTQHFSLHVDGEKKNLYLLGNETNPRICENIYRNSTNPNPHAYRSEKYPVIRKLRGSTTPYSCERRPRNSNRDADTPATQKKPSCGEKNPKNPPFADLTTALTSLRAKKRPQVPPQNSCSIRSYIHSISPDAPPQ